MPREPIALNTQTAWNPHHSGRSQQSIVQKPAKPVANSRPQSAVTIRRRKRVRIAPSRPASNRAQSAKMLPWHRNRLVVALARSAARPGPPAAVPSPVAPPGRGDSRDRSRARPPRPNGRQSPRSRRAFSPGSTLGPRPVAIIPAASDFARKCRARAKSMRSMPFGVTLRRRHKPGDVVGGGRIHAGRSWGSPRF